MQNISNINQLNIHYSYKHFWSQGIHLLDLKLRKFLMLQNNFLLERWNEEDSQANIYIFSGIGAGLNEKKKIYYTRESKQIGNQEDIMFSLKWIIFYK